MIVSWRVSLRPGQAVGQSRIGTFGFDEQRFRNRSEGALELQNVQRADDRRRHRNGRLWRKAVDAPALNRGHAMAQTRQGEDLVSHSADHVLRLSHPAARDARAAAQRIEPAHADQIDGSGRSCGEWVGGGTEQQAEARPDRAELRPSPE